MRGRAAALPLLHVVTDDETLARPDWSKRAAEVLEAAGSGVALHLRGPRSPGGTLFELARVLLPVARAAGAMLLVNDRADVALAAAVDGVHLGRRSLRVADARHVLGEGVVIGISCHTPADVSTGRREGADYAFAGTVFPTPSHPGSPGIGGEGLAALVAEGSGLPVVAIGGVTLERVVVPRTAGAVGVAVVRGVWNHSDPAEAAVEYIAALRPIPARAGGEAPDPTR